MSHEATCGTCGGTGKVMVYEPWERVHIIIDQSVEYAERIGHEVVSLDVEGSYPDAIVLGTIYHNETPIEAVERQLSHWPMHGDDIPTHPLNNDSGLYRPVDPRFYGLAVVR